MKHRLDYPYIRAWGWMMGSLPYYIDEQVKLARQDKAPQTATYRNDDGSWNTIEGCKRLDTRRLVTDHAKFLMGGGS
jgi:hypothetical protein